MVIEGGLNSIYRTFRGALRSSCVFIFSRAVKIHLVFQRIYGREAERNFYESQLIILDTLEKVLNSVKDLFKLNLLRDIHVFMYLAGAYPGLSRHDRRLLCAHRHFAVADADF